MAPSWFVPRKSTEVLNVELPISSQLFVELFFGHETFITARLQEIGSQDINVSSWKYIGQGRYSRTLKHKHPVPEFGWVPWVPRLVASSNSTLLDYLPTEKVVEIVETCTIGNVPLHDFDVILSWRIKDLANQASCQVITSVSFVFHRPSLMQSFVETEGLQEIRSFFLTWSNAVRKEVMMFLVGNQAGNAQKTTLVLPYIAEAIAAAKAGRPPLFGGQSPSMPSIPEDEEDTQVEHVWKRVASTEALDLAAEEGTEQDTSTGRSIVGLIGGVTDAVWKPLSSVIPGQSNGAVEEDSEERISPPSGNDSANGSTAFTSSSSSSSGRFKRPVRSPSIASDTSAIAFDVAKKTSPSRSTTENESESAGDGSVDEDGRGGATSRDCDLEPESRDREYNCIKLFCF